MPLPLLEVFAPCAPVKLAVVVLEGTPNTVDAYWLNNDIGAVDAVNPVVAAFKLVLPKVFPSAPVTLAVLPTPTAVLASPPRMFPP
jgi:hypothetical protein